MGRLTLNLLGTPKVLHAGQPVSFRTRKALALLIYLAVEGDRDGRMQMHSRETLTTLFWPESDRKAGRATLRSTLLYLRKSIAHTGDDADTEAHLIVERDALGFNPASDHELDLGVIEAAAETTDTTRLREAIACYRGDFLGGFSLGDAPEFDDWAGIQRKKWHRQAEVVFDRLSQVQAESGRDQAGDRGSQSVVGGGAAERDAVPPADAAPLRRRRARRGPARLRVLP